MTSIRFGSAGLAVVLALGLATWFGLQSSDDETAAIPSPETPVSLASETIQLDPYGLPARHDVQSRRMMRNETLTDLLFDADVTPEALQTILKKATSVIDIRSMQAGKPIRIYVAASGRASHLVYEASRQVYYTFDLSPPYAVTRNERPVEIKRHEISGTIKHSLFVTLQEAASSNRLASLLGIRLSEIYAWQVDFYRLQPGDAFKIVYDVAYVDDEPIDIRAIPAVRFVHRDRPFLAFAMVQDGRTEYFDEEGQSLRKSFLSAPVKYSRISSRFSYRRFHPVQRRNKPHFGTDYAAPRGTPIVATGDGVVVAAQYKKYNGNYVMIDHNSTYRSGYLHMSRIASGIKPGTFVQQGDIIGYVGSTGLATGNHVCYRFYKNNQPVDPLREEFPSAYPVADENWTLFANLRDAHLATLNSVLDFYQQPTLVESVLLQRSTASAALFQTES